MGLKKSGNKNIRASGIEQLLNDQKYRKNKRAWESSLKQHLPIDDLPDFDTIYKAFYNIIKNIFES